MLLFIGLTAVFLRLWQLGEIPPGLYRDEAYNGLDAVGVLSGKYALIFPANNGREPLYIYLTAVMVALFGQTAVAVRLAAALVGSLTTWLVYKLGDAWFSRFVGLAAAWLWATTFWPIHLSRIGLRAILLVPTLTLTFWLATLAARQKRPFLWLLAGLTYGLSFYTYLAVRFTPVLLLCFALYLLWQKRLKPQQSGLLWFGVGTAVLLLPLGWLIWQQPDLLLGRTGQVSILNPTINNGNFWLTLWRKTAQAVGMFIWRGDSIVRHNALLNYPAGNGRFVFDPLLALPFLLGIALCLRRWRRPAAALTLLWTVIMLGPTILAEDTPHFLRAVGVLPAALLLPALGLETIWHWRGQLGRAIVGLLLVGSLGLTVRDLLNYGQQPVVAYLFEDGARTLAETATAATNTTAVYLDNRYRHETAGWPSIPFLLGNTPVRWYNTDLPNPLPLPATVYVWPFAERPFSPQTASKATAVSVSSGALGRGDFEETAYPLYLVYTFAAEADTPPPQLIFDNQLTLVETAVVAEGNSVQVTLGWQGDETAVLPTLIAFVHITTADGLSGQTDNPPGQSLWPAALWRPGLTIREQRTINLSEPLNSHQHRIFVGLYDSQTLQRIPITAPNGTALGDQWQIWP